jgi:catechol 2,3-dioxygenase-like lactoylglutathione lyase family enzyme
MLQLLSAGRLFQIGIVVPDLRKSLDLYSRAFGLGPWIGFHFTPENVKDFTYRGRPANYSIDIALTVDPSPQVELIQVHGAMSLYHEWIERHGYGVQHLGVRVDDARAVTKEMVAAGYEVIQSGHGYGAEGDGMFVHFDTMADFGIITEVIEVPKARRTPDFVWPPES